MALPLAELSINREYMLILRDGLLKQVDAIERMLAISPRTAELRRERKSLFIAPDSMWLCKCGYSMPSTLDECVKCGRKKVDTA